MKRPRTRSAVSNRIRIQRRSGGIAAGVAIVAIVAFIVFLGPWATLMYGPGLPKLTPEQQVTAINDFRGRLISVGTVLLAAGVLFYTARNFRLSRESHVTDRYTKAIEQLGSAGLDVRLGAIYALERIMADSPRDHPTIVEVLAAYVREHAKLASREKRLSDHAEQGGVGVPSPYTDVQAVLTVLGRRPAGREERGRLNLQSTYLAGAELADANFAGANLFAADLSGARLSGADLSGAMLHNANLTSAIAPGVKLNLADLQRAKLANADLNLAHLVQANLVYADLNHAFVIASDLRKATLAVADLTETDLTDADLTGANLDSATMVETTLVRATLVRALLTNQNRVNVNMTDADTTDTIWEPVKIKDLWKHGNA